MYKILHTTWSSWQEMSKTGFVFKKALISQEEWVKNLNIYNLKFYINYHVKREKKTLSKVQRFKGSLSHTHKIKEKTKGLLSLKNGWKFETKSWRIRHVETSELMSKSEDKINTRPFPSWSPSIKSKWIWKQVESRLRKCCFSEKISNMIKVKGWKEDYSGSKVRLF